jgi:hypothetical protein
MPEQTNNTTAIVRPLRPKPDLMQIEQYSQIRLADKQIAALLRMTLAEWIAWKKDPDVDMAIERGRALGIQNAGVVVMHAIQGHYKYKDPLTGVEEIRIITREQLDAARFYLEKHAPHYLKD